MYLLSSEGDKEKNKHFSGSCFSRVHVLVGVNVRTSVCGGYDVVRDISSTSVCLLVCECVCLRHRCVRVTECACSCVNAFVCVSVSVIECVFARV